MLKAMGWLLKASLFAALILVASHLITWNGRTVSDQVRSGLSSAERAIPTKDALKTVKKKSKALVEDAKEAASNIGIQGRLKKPGGEAIESEDREELQALIHSSDET